MGNDAGGACVTEEIHVQGLEQVVHLPCPGVRHCGSRGQISDHFCELGPGYQVHRQATRRPHGTSFNGRCGGIDKSGSITSPCSRRLGPPRRYAPLRSARS